MIYIYCLIDPFTNHIRYIGKAERPNDRLSKHCCDQSITYRTNWIKSLITKGERPILAILDVLSDSDDWQKAEIEWIAKGRALGWPLTNCTDGGDGVVNLPPEIRERMTLAVRGRKASPETLIRIGNASRGRKHSEESKAYMRKIMLNRQFTPEWKDKLVIAVRKFDQDRINTVLGLLAFNIKVKDIAYILNVHRTTISKIKLGTYHNRHRKDKKK